MSMSHVAGTGAQLRSGTLDANIMIGGPLHFPAWLAWRWVDVEHEQVRVRVRMVSVRVRVGVQGVGCMARVHGEDVGR